MTDDDLVQLPTRTCKRCGYSWHPNKAEPPQQCARCRSPYWNKDYKHRNKIAQQYR